MCVCVCALPFVLSDRRTGTLGADFPFLSVMKENVLMELRRYTPLFPWVPHGRYVSHVGSAEPADGAATHQMLNSSSKILGIFISKPPTGSARKREREEESGNGQGGGEEAPGIVKKKRRVLLLDDDDDSDEEAVVPVKEAPPPLRTVYVRMQYDKACIETLPLEVMRLRHPQLLIDCLLGNSMWA